MKKTLIYITIFILSMIFNTYLIFRLNRKNLQTKTTQKVLKEIETQDPDRQFQKSSAPFVLGEYTTQFQLADSRVANLKTFFRKHNSVLYDHAEFIVKTADKYGFDYRLIPAIAMQESNLCRLIPENSYNCWGWGIYGSIVTRFSSYEEAIETVAKGLKTEYIDKGYITASAIMQKYTPSSNGSWAHGVNTFLKILQ